MPRYLLKGLLITLAVIGTLIGTGFGVNAAISANFERNLRHANQQGAKEGLSQGQNAGLWQGNEAGYQAGGKLGYVTAGGANATQVLQPGYYFEYNPTYDEVMSILNGSDMTTAEQVLAYCKANAIRAAYVRVPIARPAPAGRIYLYQLLAFDTTDKGLIIIEPASRRTVKVEVGKSYSQLNGFPPSSFDDTITKVTIVW